MSKLSVSFKNCRYSKALEDNIAAQFEDAVTFLHENDVSAVHVTVSEENGVYTPGPDVFSCVLVAVFADHKNVRLSVEGASPYDSVDRLFGMFRRTLAERKRRRVNVRNDVRRNVVRAKVAGGR